VLLVDRVTPRAPPASGLSPVATASFDDHGTPAARRVTRRRQQTRERLMEAGFEVFAERGLSATIEEVCERAGYTTW
jgi:hypothetical protein